MKNVEVEDEPAVASALELTAHGIELADALHLASRPPHARFVSFDQALCAAPRAGLAQTSRLE